MLAGLLFLFVPLVATGALTVVTYNVENYLVADRMVDGVYRSAYPKPEAERAALRQVIATLAPDILALQEMGAQPFLDEFQRELKLAGQNYPFSALLEGPDPERHVAVLSRVPFQGVRRHARLDTGYPGQKDLVKRGALEVVFATDQGEFSLFVVHLKSKHTERKDDPESRAQRTAEAEAVRDLVLFRYPDPAKGRFIVCGDWNDTPGSRTVRTLLKRGALSVGELVGGADSHGETWTHFYRREDSYTRIDYFLVSAPLKAAVVGGAAVVWDGPGVREASDHRPVVLRLNLTVAGR